MRTGSQGGPTAAAAGGEVLPLRHWRLSKISIDFNDPGVFTNAWANKVRKTIARFVGEPEHDAGSLPSPPGRSMGHAGAIISYRQGAADARIAALRGAGIAVALTPADMGSTLAEALGIAVGGGSGRMHQSAIIRRTWRWAGESATAGTA